MIASDNEKIHFRFVQERCVKYRSWLFRAFYFILSILVWVGINFYFGNQRGNLALIIYIFASVFLYSLYRNYPNKFFSRYRTLFNRFSAFGKPYFDEYSFTLPELELLIYRKHWIWPGYAVTIPPLENAMRELVKDTYYKTPIEEHTLACVTNIEALKEIINKNQRKNGL